MQLPSTLIQRVEQLIEGHSMKSLHNRWAEMSLAYRAAQTPSLDETSALAYLVGRLPATYAACRRVLEIATAQHLPSFTSQLDVGAGPGAAIWAARSLWPSLSSIGLEQSPAWLKIGAQVTPHVQWKRADLLASHDLPSAELVTAAYVLNELPASQQQKILQQLWDCCQGWLVLIEPGTPAGYQRVLQARDWLIPQGAHVVAPCPGPVECPLRQGNQWCHFGVRLNRPRFQRLAKGAEVSWEDERFSFMVLSRQPVPVPEGRALHFPQKRGGHVWVELCTSSGVDKRVLSRRDGALYKATRRMHWGDAFPPPVTADFEEEQD